MKFIIFLTIFFNFISIAQEPLIMTLKNIVANDSLIFALNRDFYNCYPYGVITIEKLYRDPKVTQSCKKEYLNFIQKNPKLYYLGDYLLHVEQNYMVVLQKEGCIVFSHGKKSFSEILLENGLAIINPKVRHEEYNAYFQHAYMRAKREKKGIWGDPAIRKCTAELLRE